MEGGQLTESQIAHLAQAIYSNNMESIALAHLGEKSETIKNLKTQHRDNIEAFNRDLIRNWMYRNPGNDQKEVRLIKWYIYYSGKGNTVMLKISLTK